METVESSNNGKSPILIEDRMAKKPVGERYFPPFIAIVKPNGKEPLSNEDGEMLTDNFDSGSENDFDVICKFVMLFLFYPLNLIGPLR